MTGNLLKKFYNFLIIILARPKFQKFYELLFRILIGFLGYMNFSEDFKFTGEKRLVKKLAKYNVATALDIGANKGQWARMVLDNTNWSVISFEPQKSAFKILEELLIDYNCYQILPSGQVLYKINVKNPIRNFYQLSNFLFVRSDIEINS